MSVEWWKLFSNSKENVINQKQRNKNAFSGLIGRLDTVKRIVNFKIVQYNLPKLKHKQKTKRKKKELWG